MPATLTKVVYKPDTQSTEEYTVIVNPEEYKKWIDGDTTIPLAQVVDSFKVFHSTQGSQGILGQASNQQLDTVFGTSNEDDVVEHILKNGKSQPHDGFKHNPELNSSRGTRGN
ncbi:hypothetical protein D9619_000601 [Psilocybe cf. subviscida]|uniref:Ribosome maturation protein SDO1/SBDS N-terminal domain-containing protein n=1 Tax=Psilocybe cf. subviscida TaxID=2480587 RepID=A0A8H5F411_9AGAR|nr:hypothetical protein D9619_000601 [Psilocybe cf. subviscida]